MLSAYDGGQVPRYYGEALPKIISGQLWLQVRKQAQSSWPQVAQLGRARGKIQTLICPTPLIP